MVGQFWLVLLSCVFPTCLHPAHPALGTALPPFLDAFPGALVAVLTPSQGISLPNFI